MKKPLTLLFLFFVGSALGAMLPEKGVPLMENFAPQQYHNNGKVWEIRSAPNGIVYMAADGGLLEYDGKNWKDFKGSNGFTRSVLVVNDSLIYTGSDLDFGVWRRDKYLDFGYSSLYPFQEEVRDENEEFWDVHRLNDDIVFVSSRNIYIYKNQQLIKIAAPSAITGSFWVNNDLYFADEKYGVHVFEEYSLKKVFDFPDLERTDITGMYENESGLVIVTRDLGLSLFTSGKISRLDNILSEKLMTAKVFSFDLIGKTHIAFGTVLKGLYIADLDGNIIHQINRHKGLPSNTVLSLHYSPAGKLWLGMDYGVSALDLKNNFTTFYDYRGDFGTGYTAILKDEFFYLGTNQGLYLAKWEELNNNLEFFKFQLIPGTEGQVWTLKNIDNTLLMGHDKGLFLLNDGKVERLSNHEGVWTIITYKDFLFTGNYNGISIFQKSDNKWIFLKKMDLILGSCNQLLIENENILWVNIPNFGVIRALLDQDLNPAERLIFPVSLFEGQDPFILQSDRGIHVVTDQFQYVFNPSQKEFIQETQTKVFPEVENLLPGIYQPVALHDDYDFYPVYNGFAFKYLTEGDIPTAQNHVLTLRKMEAFNNHERVLLHPGSKVHYRLNNIHIEFIVPNQKGVLYQYKLNNSGEWSAWVPENTINLLNVKYGAYELSVRALIDNEIADNQMIAFRIATPWYYSWIAFVLYILLLGAIIYFIVFWFKVSLKKQKKALLVKEQISLRRQTEKHKQEILLLDQKRLQAEYDQLKQQLKNKTIELANKARDNEEKNRLLLALKEKCEKAQQNPAIFDIKWGEMQRILDSYLKLEDNTFEIQMDELHQEFFRKLKERHPDLSSHDLRLCAYLKIGLNSKEIAEMLNILPSSFYISRSRLRKKLNLKTEEDLYNFLNAV